MLFIEKEGIYRHGIFWIGTDKEEGIKKCKEFASKDSDDYHEWGLFEFAEQSGFDNDPIHEELFKCKKISEEMI